MSDNMFVSIKAVFSFVVSTVLAAVNAFIPLFVILFFSLIGDYTTGMTAAGMNGELSSRKGWKGIIKKLYYGIAVAVGFGVDYIVQYLAKGIGLQVSIPVFFGILVTVWLILNEWVSMLENLAKIGVPLPKFLISALAIIGKMVEQAGETNEQTK
ncbi:phage holin family protein [Petroclostridium sp. X23]|uniref:phage holin family protein n=1 Tax=Petroclostridium sp. X23 TaxID=3045146 RepID=UPI0024AD0080|nr:phage holin family protein [Petroclostridium sp. X23]WHH59182.1 phage holin family protein [Petroclostridium sp. X23]